jgi:hypothetical protein
MVRARAFLERRAYRERRGSLASRRPWRGGGRCGLRCLRASRSEIDRPDGARAQGVQAKVEFNRQPDDRKLFPEARLQVAVIEGLYEHKGEKERQDEVDDRRRFMPVRVVERPIRGEIVEE